MILFQISSLGVEHDLKGKEVTKIVKHFAKILGGIALEFLLHRIFPKHLNRQKHKIDVHKQAQ